MTAVIRDISRARYGNALLQSAAINAMIAGSFTPC